YLFRQSTTGSSYRSGDYWGAPSQPDREIFVLAVRGTNLYVGGNFGRLGPSSRSQLARVSTERNGEVDLLWNPNVTGSDLSQVNALVVTGSYRYFGRSFDRVGGLTRKNIARVSLDGTGASDPYWDASTDGGTMYALAANGEEIYAGGWFSQIGGQPRHCLAKL